LTLTIRFSRAARRDIADIFDYTLSTWGRDQANLYLDGLRAVIEGLQHTRSSWKPMPTWKLTGHRVKFRHHYVFFVVTEDGLTIARVLHERRDTLRHLVDEG
jgi:toxin ParE1/3/4